MDDAGEDIRVEVDEGGLARVTLNRPDKRNAITQAMWAAIPNIAHGLDANDSVKVVILAGAGERAFSAGADIAEFPDTYATAENARRYNDAVRAAQSALSRMAKPVIAAVRGVCVGGGCGLALACDLRFAAADASFAIPPARLGAAYSFGDTKQVVDLVGPARAKDILFSGRRLEAKEALAIGLVDRVVPSDTLVETVDAYARGLAALSQASIRTAKAMVNAVIEGVDAETPALRRLFDDAFAGDDFAEGYRAFIEGRKPVFR